MEKLIYLIFELPERSGSDLCAGLLEAVVPPLKQAGATGIRINVHNEYVYAGVPRASSNFRKGPPIRAMLCFSLDSADLRSPCEKALATQTQSFAGYQVVESCPLMHETRAGNRAPGLNQFTCINRRPDLDYETFLPISQQDHRKVAIDPQSTVGYVQNEIVRALTDDAPPFDEVVEKTFPVGALTDPHVLYNYAESQEVLATGIELMLESCERFLDFEPMEMIFMSEHVKNEV